MVTSCPNCDVPIIWAQLDKSTDYTPYDPFQCAQNAAAFSDFKGAWVDSGST